jgi:hypothetical protein
MIAPMDALGQTGRRKAVQAADKRDRPGGMDGQLGREEAIDREFSQTLCESPESNGH